MNIKTDNSITLVCAEEGMWLTQSFPTNFPNFWKNKMLTESESVEDYREVTEKEKELLETKYTEYKSPPQVFIDLWNTACGIWGKYNEKTGFFELNGLIDIGYGEAVKIYDAGPLIDSLYAYSRGVFTGLRTVLPAKRLTGIGYNHQTVFLYTNVFPGNLDVINLNPSNKEADFYILDRHRGEGLVISHYTFGAKKFIGVLNLSRCTSNYFDTFMVTNNKTTHLLIRCLHTNADMRNAPFDLESWKFLVKEATNTTAITIKVQAQIYNKLTDENNIEWYQVLLDAAEKNITFVAV